MIGIIGDLIVIGIVICSIFGVESCREKDPFRKHQPPAQAVPAPKVKKPPVEYKFQEHPREETPQS